MKRTCFAVLASAAFSVFALLPFAGSAQDGAAFDKTTARLEKGGVSFAYTDGAAINVMVDQMVDSFAKILTPEDSEAQALPEEDVKKILGVVKKAVGDLGLKSVVGVGTSVKKNGDYYRIREFACAPEATRKGLFWDLIGAPAKGPAPELKLVSPKSAIACSSRFEPGKLYAFLDKILRDALDEDTMAIIDQQISNLASSGIQPDKLLDCISGFTAYIDGREFTQEDLAKIMEAGENDEEANPVDNIAGIVPNFAIILTTKSDLCWKALTNFLSQISPDIVQDDKIVPAKGFAIFQAGSYLVVTNEEAAVRDRIAGKGSDLTANAEFAKMLKLMPADFYGFSWVSEDYFKTIASFTSVMQGVAGEVLGDSVPATDPSMLFLEGFHSALATLSLDADGMMTTSVTPDLQIALLNSSTLVGIVSGLLPYAGPFTKILVQTLNNVGGNSDEESIEQLNRQFSANAAFAMLQDSESVPADALIAFNVDEESGELLFAKWNDGKEDFVAMDGGDIGSAELPFFFLNSPADAAKAEKPEEVVVFYEDPGDFFDGIFVALGDGSVKFLEGNFMDHAEALEAIANTFGFSEKAASDLVKKGKAIDALLGD